MKIATAMLVCLLLAACGHTDYQFANPDEKKTDFELSYQEQLPGIPVNLDGYRE